MIQYLDLVLVFVASVCHPLGNGPPEIFLHPLLCMLATGVNRNIARLLGQADFGFPLGLLWLVVAHSCLTTDIFNWRHLGVWIVTVDVMT